MIKYGFGGFILKSIGKNYFYNLVYKLLAILTPLIITPYITRTLKVDAIGMYSYTFSIVSYFSIFGILGLDMLGQLQIAKVRDDQNELSKSFVNIFFSKCITTFIVLALYIWFSLQFYKYRKMFLVLSIYIIANVIDISWLYQGIETFKSVMIKNVLIKSLTIVMIFLLVKKPSDIYLYAFILQGSVFIGNVSLWININKIIKFEKPDIKRAGFYIKKSLIYFLPAIATLIYTTTDKIMLGAILNSDFQNGIYDQAHKIEQTAITLISSLGIVLLPRLTYLNNQENEKEKLKKYIIGALDITGLLEAPLMFGIMASASVLVPVFLGTDFLDAVGLLELFSLLILFSGANTMIGNSCLVSRGKQKEYNIGVFTSAMINVILNLLLIPIYKSYGAALASLASEIIVFVIFLHYSDKDIVSLSRLWKMWRSYLLYAFIMGIFVKLIGSLMGVSLITLLIQIIFGACLYFILLIIKKNFWITNILKSIKGAD